MKGRIGVILIIIGIILLLGSIFPLMDLLLGDRVSGSIEPNWAYPTGIQLENLSPESSAKLEYSSTEMVKIFLITRDHAMEFRGPSMSKEPLPDPIEIGSDGVVMLSFKDGGNMEVLVIPSDGSYDFVFEYTISGIDQEGYADLVSISFFLLSGGILITIPLTIRKMNRKKGHE